MKKHARASVLLMSVLVIGVLTLFLALTMAEVNLSTGYQVLNTTENRRSYYAAESCLEESLLRYERDASFTGTTFDVDEDSICTSTISGTQVHVTVTNGSYSESFTGTFSTYINGLVTNVDLTGWKED
jgi:hypothetical protein